MTKEAVKHKRERHSALINERDQGWLSHWQDLGRFYLPRRNQFMGTRRNRGSSRNDSILNETGTLAARTFGSGMHAGVTSPSRPWFRLGFGDPKIRDIPAVRTWLHEVEQRMRMIYQRSNLYNVLPIIYQELSVFGVSPLGVMEDERDTIRIYPYPVGSYALASSSRREVDTMYREFELTTKQIVEEYGLNNVSQNIQMAYKRGHMEVKHSVIHVIEPNNDRDRRFTDNVNMPVRSCHFEKASNEEKFLRVSGFEESPLMAPRYEVVGEDVYATSCPGMIALGSNRGLQKSERWKLEGIEKMVKPPLQAPMSLKNQYSSLLPGDITYVDATSPTGGVRPIFDVNPRILELQQDMDQVEDRINRAFFVDLFLMLANSDRRQITAREVEERHEEKLLMLGPVLQNIHTELLDPLIDRTFAIMIRRGEVPEPPKEIEGMEMRVEYISILAQAQQAVGVGSVERAFSFVGNLAGVNPEILDKLDFDQGVDEYGEMIGLPPNIVRPDEAVAAIRAQRAQAQQAEAMAQNAQTANTGAQAAKLLSETDTGDGSNALERALGLA